MVAALVAVTMLSAVIAVAPMQQASAEDRDGKDGKDRKDSKDGKDGDSNNKVKIKQSNECKKVIAACGNLLFGEIDQNTGID